MTHQYTVIKGDNGKYQAVIILSEHNTEKEAIEATLEVMNQESKEQMQQDIKKLRSQGINAVTV